jgi:CxxC motif-containing protein (DUF1111 family)
MFKKLMICAALFPVLACYHKVATVVVTPPPGLIEAPAGFDTFTNGFADQVRHDADRVQFEEDAVLPQLGPNYNARACADCHDSPISGAGSQVFEHRIAPDDKDDAVAAATLVHDRTTNPETQQKSVFDAVNALRPSLSLMGDGFVEDVPDAELIAIAGQNHGQFIMVPVLESPGTVHVGRFGTKDQHASLLSFAADADFNEKGVENRFVKAAANSNGIEDQEPTCNDGGEDIDCYARFMRALKAPSRGNIDQIAISGEQVFNKIGCSNCHVSTLYTSKYIFHPFGDYLLHDIGTGDGIPQGDAPANKVRTQPLWGLRARPRYLHDGRAYDLQTAIAAHHNEASYARNNFNQLNKSDKADLLIFLNSL